MCYVGNLLDVGWSGIGGSMRERRVRRFMTCGIEFDILVLGISFFRVWR